MLDKVYNGLADKYFESRGMFPISDILEMFRLNVNLISGRLLDLGCGTGHPVCEHFLSHKWSVTGVDISSRMLEIAKTSLPSGHFIQQSMDEVDMGEEVFDAVSAIYSLFHLPIVKQSVVFANVHRALKPGGKFLFTYAGKDYTGSETFEGEIEFLGTALPYAHKTEQALVEELTNIGFSVEMKANIRKGGEVFIWVIAQKN